MSYDTDEFLHERFLAAIRSELRLRHVPIDRREFEEYMAATRPLVMPEGDSPVWWADAFVEARQACYTPSVPSPSNSTLRLAPLARSPRSPESRL